MGVIYLQCNFAQQNSETDKIGVIAEDQQITGLFESNPIWGLPL